ncbi:fibroblast growth factor 3/7/10/22 [Ciona intestinalis]
MLKQPEPTFKLTVTSSIFSVISTSVTSTLRQRRTTATQRHIVTSLMIIGLIVHVTGEPSMTSHDIGTCCPNNQRPAHKLYAQLILRMCELCLSGNDAKNNFIPTPTSSHYDVINRHSPVLLRHKRMVQGGDRRMYRLYNRNHYFIEIKQDGKVRGSYNKSPQTEIEVQSVAAGGVIRFYSPSTGRYLAMNRHSKLYASRNYRKIDCDFVEKWQDFYATYRSLHQPGDRHRRRSRAREWYIGIDRRGRSRKGRNVKPGSSSAHFLPLPV